MHHYVLALFAYQLVAQRAIHSGLKILQDKYYSDDEEAKARAGQLGKEYFSPANGWQGHKEEVERATEPQAKQLATTGEDQRSKQERVEAILENWWRMTEPDITKIFPAWDKFPSEQQPFLLWQAFARDKTQMGLCREFCPTDQEIDGYVQNKAPQLLQPAPAVSV